MDFRVLKMLKFLAGFPLKNYEGDYETHTKILVRSVSMDYGLWTIIIIILFLKPEQGSFFYTKWKVCSIAEMFGINFPQNHSYH